MLSCTRYRWFGKGLFLASAFAITYYIAREQPWFYVVPIAYVTNNVLYTRWIKHVVVLDAFTYAGHERNLAPVQGHAGFRLVRGDVRDEGLVAALFAEERIDTILHAVGYDRSASPSKREVYVDGLANVGVYQRSDYYHAAGVPIRQLLDRFIAACEAATKPNAKLRAAKEHLDNLGIK